MKRFARKHATRAQFANLPRFRYEIRMYSLAEIKRIVEEAIPGAEAEARDMTGTGDHIELFVISDAFQGKGPVDRHRMVYSALGKAVGNEIHALALKTLTPQEAGKS